MHYQYMTKSIEKALTVLRQGGVILYPTDTIWGIGCDATNRQAVDRVFRIKNRTDQKSMLVLVDQLDMIYEYVEAIPEMALELLKITEGPLTIIYPGARNLAPNLVASDGSVGIRICRISFCQQLIQKFGKPIVSTSANKSGRPAPKNYTQIESTILKEVDYVVEEKEYPNSFGKPSSIIKLDMDNRIQIIRQ